MKNVIIHVGLVVVWRCFVDAWTVLLLIMINYWLNSTLSWANNFLDRLSKIIGIELSLEFFYTSRVFQITRMNILKRTGLIIRCYVPHLDFSWILQARLLLDFILSILYVCLILRRRFNFLPH